MKMLLEKDQFFADLLDFNCQKCSVVRPIAIRGDHPTLDLGNGSQLLTLQTRINRLEHAKEKPILKALTIQCINCFEKGRNFGDSITARSSCAFRAGLIKK